MDPHADGSIWRDLRGACSLPNRVQNRFSCVRLWVSCGCRVSAVSLMAVSVAAGGRMAFSEGICCAVFAVWYGTGSDLAGRVPQRRCLPGAEFRVSCGPRHRARWFHGGVPGGAVLLRTDAAVPGAVNRAGALGVLEPGVTARSSRPGRLASRDRDVVPHG